MVATDDWVAVAIVVIGGIFLVRAMSRRAKPKRKPRRISARKARMRQAKRKAQVSFDDGELLEMIEEALDIGKNGRR